MKVLMTDTVEVAHAIIPELENTKITEQSGLIVLSKKDGSAGGMPCLNYILNLQKGVTVTLPDRLGRRLCAIGCAKAVWGK